MYILYILRYDSKANSLFSSESFAFYRKFNIVSLFFCLFTASVCCAFLHCNEIESDSNGFVSIECFANDLNQRMYQQMSREIGK